MDIRIRDTIGLSTRKDEFNSQLQKGLDSDEEINIMINSPGGSVYHGVNMYNHIRMALSKGATINTYNTGMAASMASMIFGAVPRANRFMAESSTLMVHNPKGIAFGDEDEMRKEREMLEKITDISADAYARATGTNREYMRAVMKRTTWYNPQDAKEAGFAGSIVDGFNDVEEVKAIGMEKSAFENMPSNCKAYLCFEDKSSNIKDENEFVDLTKITNSQIREKTWKKSMRY